jgi:hypothetical protein
MIRRTSRIEHVAISLPLDRKTEVNIDGSIRTTVVDDNDLEAV